MRRIVRDVRVGVGVDVEHAGRFRDPRLARNRALLRRIFTPRELAYCASKKNPAPHLAARYAGKEAVLKALADAGVKKLTPNNYRDIEIARSGTRPPRVILWKAFVGEKGLRVAVSLSHAGDIAIAFAVAYAVRRR